MRIIFSLLIVSVAAVFAAGCDTDRQPPLPYAVMPRDANLLQEILGNAGVEVSPPEGVSPEIGAQLANALASGLQDQDIPAIAGKKLSGAHQIRGMARMEPGVIVINWQLYEPGGEELAGVEVRDALATGTAPDKLLDSNAVQALTTRTVTALALHFPAMGGEHGENLQIFVADIADAPGDGGKSLPLALRNALRAAGMRVTQTPGPEAIRIEGQIQVSPQGAGELITLAWRVLAADGTEIGFIDQSNPVAARRTDGNWGELAFAAAAGAADGIIPLLADYRTRTAGKAD